MIKKEVDFIKKIFLKELPTKEGKGLFKNKQVIDWQNSIGYKVKFIYDDIEGEVEIIDYNSKKQRLYIQYKNKEPFKIHTSSFIECRLGKLLSKITNEFKVEVGTRYNDNNRDVTITDRKYKVGNDKITRKYYKYRCNKCGFECGEHYKNGKYREEHWIEESNLLKGNGCACCNYNQIVVSRINGIPETAPWMVKYFQGGYDEAKLYTRSSACEIKPICPDCGKVKNKLMKIYVIYKEHSIGCNCSDNISYPNKFCFSFLEQLNIEFAPEYNPNWIRPKKYDFYFEINKNHNTYKYIVEMDGGLGHGNKVHSKSKLTIEETLEIDDYKDELAKKHGIKVIRIDSKVSDLEYIKNNILDSKLNDLFNLSKIDWNKCEEYALSNLCKKACTIKRDNPDMSTTEIGKIMKLSYATIGVYLKKGNNLGWCYYNPKKENFGCRGKSGKANGKPVAIFKDGVKLGEFESCHDLDRQSEEKFGMKLLNSNVSAICRGKYPYKQYKGFTFKYII